MSPSTLSRNLHPLERQGLVHVAVGTRRAKQVALTAQGGAAIDRAAPYWEAVQARFVSQVSADSWHEMTGRLEALVDAVRGARR